MRNRPKPVAPVTLETLDDVPPDAVLCRDDRCDRDDLHLVHAISRRGATAKTVVCPTCKRNVRVGAPCCAGTESNEEN